MSFKDKVVVITGAAGGIGKATSIHFAKLSAELALIDKNSEDLKKVAQDCEKTKVFSVVADVSSDAEIDRSVKLILKEFSKIDVLVNCVGITGNGGIEDGYLMANYDRSMNINLRSVIYLTQRLVPALIETKGAIVNISSVASAKVSKGLIPYIVSKAGLSQFTKCIALELGSKGVRVNSILPGPVKTDLLFNNGLMDKESQDVLWESMGKACPLQRVIQPEEIAEMIAFLASDKAKCITGSEFLIDCGLLLSEVNEEHVNELRSKS